MLTEDYILRMISQALAVLLTALGLKKSRKFAEALQALDQAIESLLGLNPNLAKQLDDHALLDILTFQGKLDIDRLLILADIYREQAEIYQIQSQPDNYLYSAQRSLRLYLEAMLTDIDQPALELVQKIESVRQPYSPSTLPVETRLALLDYLERMLASSDEFLTAARLSRSDLQESFSSLDSPDFQ